MPLSLKINNEQQVVVHLNPADAKRKPVKLFSVPTWTADDGGSATVTPAADGLSATVVATADGTTVITISAEGDPSPGEDTLTDTVTVLVVDPDAISLGLTADPPTLQP
jgi:hypothetical protein